MLPPVKGKSLNPWATREVHQITDLLKLYLSVICMCMYVHTHTHFSHVKCTILWTNTKKVFIDYLYTLLGFPGGALVKNPSVNEGDTGDMGLIPGLGRSPGVGKGNPFQYSCLEDCMNRGAWQAIVHGVAKRLTGQSLSMHAHVINNICISFSPINFFTTSR